MMLPTVKDASNCQKSIYLEKDASNRQIEMLPTIKDASDGVRKKNSRSRYILAKLHKVIRARKPWQVSENYG